MGAMGIADETNPNFVEPPSRPIRTRSDEEWAAARVDEELRELAWLCAGWAHRGRVVEELVGLVTGCACHPKVIPRDELSARLDPGPLLDALASTRARRDRLAVVAARAGGFFCTFHVTVPEVPAPDTRGVLGPISEKRQGLLERGIEEWKPRMREYFDKNIQDARTIDGIHVHVFGLELGGIGSVYKNSKHVPGGRLLDASRFEVQPNKVLFLVERDYEWDHDAAVWIDPRRLGLGGRGVPCQWYPPSQAHP
jgi:hypothetical protein